jgi:hypothetical protein
MLTAGMLVLVVELLLRPQSQMSFGKNSFQRLLVPANGIPLLRFTIDIKTSF